MRTDVVTIPRHLGIWEVAGRFASLGISGAPVVDEEGRLVGVISQTDIIRHLEDVSKSSKGADDFYSDAEHEGSGPAFRTRTAGDLMSMKAICASEQTPVERLSRLMLRKGVHRIIITRERRLVGIVTTMDILRVL